MAPGCIIIPPAPKCPSLNETSVKVKACLRSLKKAPKGSLFKKHIKSNGDNTGSAKKNGKGSPKSDKKQRKTSDVCYPKANPQIGFGAQNCAQKSCLRTTASTTTKNNAGTVVYTRPSGNPNARPAVIANSPGHRSPTVRQQLHNAQQQQQLSHHQQQQQQQTQAAKKLFRGPPKPREWDSLSVHPDSVDSEFDIYQRAEDIANIREKHLDLKRLGVSHLQEAQHEDTGGFYKGEELLDNWSDEE